MSRPHEDRERHTLVDHRPGGAATRFAVGSWLAVGVARVKADRNDACISAYETLIERAQVSNVHAGPAVVLASEDGHRVIAMVGVRGHDAFRHLTAAWDDHHRNAEHRVISESVAFTLYEVAAGTGETEVDPISHDVYVYEHVERPIPEATELFAALGASTEFRGALLLAEDAAVATATVVLSRFVHLAAYDAVRRSRAALNVLGSPGASGDASFPLHPRKTFAIARN